MNRISAALFIAGVALWLTGCGAVPRASRSTTRAASPPQKSDSSAAETVERPPAMMVSSRNEIQASLMQAYRDWEGTPYVLGGASQKGVDCSRLMNIIFDEYFGVDLPNNTRKQLNAGEGIRRAGIHAGDLVFFRTGRKTLHVGVAVNQGEFLHASTSNGVMISKLGNSYWRDRFLAARRVL